MDIYNLQERKNEAVTTLAKQIRENNPDDLELVINEFLTHYTRELVLEIGHTLTGAAQRVTANTSELRKKLKGL